MKLIKYNYSPEPTQISVVSFQRLQSFSEPKQRLTPERH